MVTTNANELYKIEPGKLISELAEYTGSSTQAVIQELYRSQHLTIGKMPGEGGNYFLREGAELDLDQLVTNLENSRDAQATTRGSGVLSSMHALFLLNQGKDEEYYTFDIGKTFYFDVDINGEHLTDVPGTVVSRSKHQDPGYDYEFSQISTYGIKFRAYNLGEAITDDITVNLTEGEIRESVSADWCPKSVRPLYL